MGKAKRIAQQKQDEQDKAKQAKEQQKTKPAKPVETEETKRLKQAYIVRQTNREAKASLILAILGVVTFFFPIGGIALSLMGFALGWRGRKSAEYRQRALTGMIVAAVGLIIAVFVAMLGDYIRHFVPILLPNI